LGDYQTIADRDEQFDELRMLGLNEEEILFKLHHESVDVSNIVLHKITWMYGWILFQTQRFIEHIKM
jgi:hypothetical protein